MEQSEYRGMLLEVCDMESGLTGWEIDFIDSLCEWKGTFTNAQAEKLQQIYDRLT